MSKEPSFILGVVLFHAYVVIRQTTAKKALKWDRIAIIEPSTLWFAL